MAYNIIPTQSTFPGDPEDRGVTISIDCQIIDFRSRMKCRYKVSSCLAPDIPRPCPAKKAGRRGCDCDQPACNEHCRYSAWRDPQAAYVYYSGSNQNLHNPNARISESSVERSAIDPRGKHRFGYKDIAFNIVDDRLSLLWTLSGPCKRANINDHLFAIPGFELLHSRFPSLRIGEILADAGFGHEEILQYVYDKLAALRTIRTRHSKADERPDICLRRGYDQKGTPLCPLGYLLYSNGHDYQRQETKWVCRQRCARQSQPDILLTG